MNVSKDPFKKINLSDTKHDYSPIKCEHGCLENAMNTI